MNKSGLKRRKKLNALKALAKKRQPSRWDGYNGLGDYHNGIYECDYVSRYTKAANNVDSKIMVVLQDWSSNDVLSREKPDPDSVKYGYGRKVATNINLKRLLKTYFGVSLSDIYATNLFPFIKMGSMSSRIPSYDLEKAAIEFARPQIEIVRPRLEVVSKVGWEGE
jgi:restriction system protein